MNETTTTKYPTPAPLKRCAIIGTAPSWKACPWTDKTLEVWGLNDAYLIGVPRADRWYDLHPVHQMHFRSPNDRRLEASTVPIGSYVRPQGHLDWLRTRPMPVFLNQHRPDFPTSRAFPKDAILEFFKTYWPMRLTRQGVVVDGQDYEVSTPSWMLMHAIMEGYTEIHVYGIHLATQWEYLQQRPNFEFLLGIAAGRGIKIVLPQAAPICRSSYRYAFEPKADLPMQACEQEIAIWKQRGAQWKQQHASLPIYAFGQKRLLRDQIRRADVMLADLRQQQNRAHVTMEQH